MNPFLENIISTAAINASKFLKRDFQEILYLHTNEKKNEFFKKSNERCLKNLAFKISSSNASFGIICENQIIKKSENEKYWEIIAIDQAENFTNGLAYWGTYIALKENEKIIAAIYYLPILDELFIAQESGVTLNKMRLSLKQKLLDSLVIDKFKIGSDIFHIFYCLASRFSIVNVKNVPQNLALINLAQKTDVQVKINEKEIIIGNDFAMQRYIK